MTGFVDPAERAGAWEYGEFVVLAVGESTAVTSINHQAQDYDHNPIDALSMLNEMGAEGWELVATLSLVPPSPNAVTPRSLWNYVLKRPRELPQAGSTTGQAAGEMAGEKERQRWIE